MGIARIKKSLCELNNTKKSNEITEQLATLWATADIEISNARIK